MVCDFNKCYRVRRQLNYIAVGAVETWRAAKENNDGTRFDISEWPACITCCLGYTGISLNL